MVLDSAEAIDNSGGDDQSYLNLGFFLPDAPSVDVIITTRHAGVAEMTTGGGRGGRDGDHRGGGVVPEMREATLPHQM